MISIIDGRLFSQAARLKRYANVQFMVIEGTDLFHTGYEIDPQAIKGALVSLSVSWQIPLIFSKSSCGTAEILTLAGGQDVKYYNEMLKRMGRKPRRIQTQKLYFLQGLPGIGPGIAKRMLEYFGSIEKVINANEYELSCIKGIGKKKSILDPQNYFIANFPERKVPLLCPPYKPHYPYLSCPLFRGQLKSRCQRQLIKCSGISILKGGTGKLVSP